MVRLKPADPFDLIRLIAKSQSDPRKAIAELVQNSLDADSRSIRITRFSQKGTRAISVIDDGHGVFPEKERPEALRWLATNIGHSCKARLTPAERHKQMTLGKYGIGLLGFWSVGRAMEIRSRVKGSDLYVLRLQEDVRDGHVSKHRLGKLHSETFTEIVIYELHVAAEPQLTLRRLAAYLAGEMRGQLLSRDVTLEIFDNVARGMAQKHLVVKPQRFQGLLVTLSPELPVPSFAPARVELYLVAEDEGRRGVVSLACGGATVLDDMTFVEGFDSPREPWSLGRFEGVIDFPDFEVAPGTRRGFVPNAASAAFLSALSELESRCREILAQDAERRRQEREADDAKDLRRVFRRLPVALPHYSLFSVRDGRGSERAEIKSGERTGPGAEEIASEVPEKLFSMDAGEQQFLFPLGPLARVEVKPKKSTLAPLSARRLKAAAFDGDGREINEGIEYHWSVDGMGDVVVEDPRSSCRFLAPMTPCETRVKVVAHQGETSAEAFAELKVSDDVDVRDGDAGVPDPQPVTAPSEGWRSRVVEGLWQYNTAHPDYRAVQDDLKRRLRYLVHLFAKEVVLRNFGDLGDAPVLERMVEVLTHVGDNIARRTGAKDRDNAEQ